MAVCKRQLFTGLGMSSIWHYYHCNSIQSLNSIKYPWYIWYRLCSAKYHCLQLFFLAHNRMLVASLCNHDLSVVVIVIVVCEHSSWPHAWPNKVHTLHAHAAISCIVAHQKLYHSDLYLLYSSHICMFILMSIVHEVINIATSNLTETHI